MVNLDGMIKRMLEIKGLSQSKEAAKLLGISPADFSNRKRRGTLLPLMIEWAIGEKIDLHWFITGEGLKRTNKETEINPLLIDVNDWLNEEEKHKDAGFRTLFRQQMIRAFFDYEDWIKKRKVPLGDGAEAPKRKVA